MTPLERIRTIVERHVDDYTLDHKQAVEAVYGITHVSLSDAGLDSLDVVELVMEVEDELGVVIDDSKVDDHTIEGTTLLEDIPHIIFNAIEA